TGMGRDGVHDAAGMPSTPDTGAIAANVSAMSHPSMCDMNPPFEKPVAKMRFGSTQYSLSRSESRSFVNCTSSTPFGCSSLQQLPAFQPLPTPSGYATMKFFVSAAEFMPVSSTCSGPLELK